MFVPSSGAAGAREAGLDTESLRLFAHLARSLHFGRTSRECHVSPSALSRSVQRLEQEAGAPLFTRDSRHVELTAAGALLLSFASDTLARWEQTLHGLRRRGQALHGTLSLFCTVTAAHSLLPSLLGAFRRAHPDVTIKLETGHAADALSALTRGDAEVAVAPLPDRVPAQLQTRVIAHTPLLFVAPENASAVSALVDARVIPWAEVPMILPQRGIARERVDRWFRQRRCAPKIYSEVPGHEAILSLVTLGCGVGVLPQLVLDKSPLASEVRVLDVRPRLAPFHVAVCAKQSGMKNPLVAAFWDSIAEPEPRASR